MKKILLLFIISFASFNVFSVELWNGFSDGMSKEQVKNRAINILKAECAFETEDLLSKNFKIFTGNQSYRNEGLIPPDEIISCDFDYTYYKNIIFKKIMFYFFDGALYALSVEWTNDISDDVVQKSIENYGKSYSEIIDYNSETDVLFLFKKPAIKTRFLLWDFDQKRVFLKSPEKEDTVWASKSAKLYSISKKFDEKYRSEIERRVTEQQRQEEATKQEKINNIQF